MSTAVSTPQRGTRSQFADKKLSFFGVVRSEFLKFRTLTTNWVMTIIIAVVMIGLALLMAGSLNMMFDSMKESADQMAQMGPDAPGVDMESIKGYAYALGAMGIDLGNMLVGSVAVVFIASEYATKSIHTTNTVVPKRSMVYLAKFIVISVYSFVLGFILAAASYFLGTLLLAQEIRDATPFEEGVVYNWLAVAIYFMFMAWMGLGFGALIRNNAGGIMLVVAVMLILPIIFMLLGIGFDWVNDFMKYLPSNLGQKMYTYYADSEIGHLEAGSWFALWAAVPALLGYLRFRFTDAK